MKTNSQRAVEYNHQLRQIERREAAKALKEKIHGLQHRKNPGHKAGTIR